MRGLGTRSVGIVLMGSSYSSGWKDKFWQERKDASSSSAQPA